MLRCYFKNSVFCSSVCLKGIVCVFMFVVVFFLVFILWDLSSYLLNFMESFLWKVLKFWCRLFKGGERIWVVVVCERRV